MNAQKIKKIIIILITLILLSVLMFFHQFINFQITTFLFNKFSIVSSENNLLVHFISVGQGDAIAINLPDGKIMLIDTGPENHNVTYTNYLNDYVLNMSRDKKIDYLVLTHADMDHVGGTLRLLQNFSVDQIFMPKTSGSTSYNEIYNYIIENCNNTTISNEQVIAAAGYKITMLKQLVFDGSNATSQIVKLEYFNKSFLFTGDIEITEEDDYISYYGEFLDVDVLKVAHHGSKDSSGAEFLNIVSPEYAIVSVGEDNMYNLPNSETLDRLTNANAKILRTDKNGNIMFAVGNFYDLDYLDGKYTVVKAIYDCRIVIVTIDIFLIINIIVICVKKTKVKKDRQLVVK